jgi:hypothetical protein
MFTAVKGTGLINIFILLDHLHAIQNKTRSGQKMTSSNSIIIVLGLKSIFVVRRRGVARNFWSGGSGGFEIYLNRL